MNYPDISLSMIEGQQHDAQEFYIKIMERLGCVCERLVNIFLCKVMQPNNYNCYIHCMYSVQKSIQGNVELQMDQTGILQFVHACTMHIFSSKRDKF